MVLQIAHIVYDGEAAYPSTVAMLKTERIPMPSAPANWFTELVEGTAVDASGNLYAGNFRSEDNASSEQPTNTIGRVDTTTHDANLWYTDAIPSSWLNGVRFLKPLDDSKSSGGRVLMADVRNHRVLELTWPDDLAPPKRAEVKKDGGMQMRVVCHDPSMIQPNDLAVTPDGRNIYLTGMRVTGNTSVGDLWHCRSDGTMERFSVAGMGRTNGIEVAPDGETLYVSEAIGGWTPSASRIWRYRLEPGTGRVVEKMGLLVDFAKLDGTGDVEVDGMRTDVTGALYVTRATRNEVIKLSPVGELLARIELSFDKPRNLELGGKDGRTLFVAGPCPLPANHSITVGCIDKVRVSHPGRAWSELQS
ncbi:hypothetical protein SYNPS1DRAFT_21539 [Syncephalis pseudoplumigaleata]|uniref:SMP-30/Gluconolactonase/LRE-like region domain-containing protein n=1 Tax=Syncephalis pseudoplumigaleata TaxID=1712513 RepID=A0A4P9Z4I8_9FUNG|nr:hypothetical protein SYNPS1DRAFT_21539 [Syncephalis pseudoplumigaleata]|eukprot:RKP26761.1 hypothetical protein SYNPS1DRAFT_21539 [Syncephalis pseudoplumigaleata]